MENAIKDIVNAGIGTVDSITSSIEENSGKIQNYIEELKEKGAAEQSDSAVKLRDFADETIKTINDYQAKVETFVSENQAKLNATLEKYNVTLPEVNLDELKGKVEAVIADSQTKVEELRAQLEESVKEAQTKLEELVAGLQNKKEDEVQAA